MEIQDNLSKAKDLVGCPRDVSINDWNGEEYNKLGFEYAMEMAEWKDDTIRDIIKKEIDRANKYYDQKLSSTQMAASIRVVQVLSELIGEKFPYDDLHMGFATID